MHMLYLKAYLKKCYKLQKELWWETIFKRIPYLIDSHISQTVLVAKIKKPDAKRKAQKCDSKNMFINYTNIHTYSKKKYDFKLVQIVDSLQSTH